MATKRKIALILCLALSTLLLFTLLSCNNNVPDPDVESGESSTEDSTEESKDKCVHTVSVVPGVSATCTESGLTEGKKCTKCGEILEEQTTIDALGHLFEGSYDCYRCDYSVTPSAGLKFSQSDDGRYYLVSGKGDCTDKDIVIPHTYYGLPVKKIKSGAFEGCTSLESITIPNSVTSIGSLAFYGCTALKSVTIPNSVVSIGMDAFNGCYSLKSITIPNSVTSIGSLAFYGCLSLKSITIPNSVTSIESFAFNGCTALTIYCEAESQPNGWDSTWNSSGRPVEWNHTHSYENGECVCGVKEG